MDPRPQSYTGGLRELVLIFFPISLMTFSNCLFLAVEKLFLARLSTASMEAAVNATYACQVFQAPCVALALMSQVFVGRWYGANDLRSIGPGIWQFIWFSILSMILTLPLGILYGQYYFQGTAIEEIALPYYYFLLSINFLYPLGATLTCFYIGRGKTGLIVTGNIISQMIKLVLAYILIFGIEGWIPSMGIMGGVVSTFIAQGSLCVLLLGIFLSKKYVEKFNCRFWRFQSKLFWECMNPGILRAINRVLSFTCWASIAHLMVAKGDDYLLILSVGGTLFLFLPFLGDAICQANTTVVSNILGAHRYHFMNPSFRSGNILAIISVSVLAIPFLLFPMSTFDYFFPNIAMEESMVKMVFFGIWLSFAFYTYGFIPISYVLAYKDTQFSLLMGLVGWVNGYLLMWVAIEKFHVEPGLFWIVLSLMHASNALLYYLRMKYLIAQSLREAPAS